LRKFNVHQLAYMALFFLLAGCTFLASVAKAEEEIDLGDSGSQTTTAQSPTTQAPVMAPTNTPIPEQDSQAEPTPTSVPEQDYEPVPTKVPETHLAHGVLKMKDIYEAGIKYYKKKDYEKAIRYLKRAVKYKQDRFTPKYYFAEAYATLGLTYEFYYPVPKHKKIAYWYYASALKYEKNNKTALKHIREVRKYKNQ